MTLGPIERLRASKRLASTTTACPAWCDGDHELTGDDQGVSHHCSIDNRAEAKAIGVHLRARETVDAPGTLGPTRLVVYGEADTLADRGWIVEIPVDASRLKTLREIVDAALALVEHQAISPTMRLGPAAP